MIKRDPLQNCVHCGLSLCKLVQTLSLARQSTPQMRKLLKLFHCYLGNRTRLTESDQFRSGLSGAWLLKIQTPRKVPLGWNLGARTQHASHSSPLLTSHSNCHLSGWHFSTTTTNRRPGHLRSHGMPRVLTFQNYCHKQQTWVFV